MFVFWLNLFLVLITSLIATNVAIKINENDISNHYTDTKPGKFMVFIATSSMILVSGLRKPLGYGTIGDTYAYSHSFNLLPTDIESIKLILEDGKDVAFTLFTILIKRYVSTDPQVFIFICALITITLTMIAFYKFAQPFYLAPFLFITWGAYLVSMNGVRQSMVASIIILATGLIIKGKWLKFFILIYALSFLHGSALIYIPLYFIVRGKAWSKKTTFILVLSGIGFVGFNTLLPSLFGAISDTQYGEYQSTFDGSFGGASYIRVLVSAIPVVLAYLSRESLSKEWKYSDIFVNFSILNFIIMMFATYNWIFARMSVYFNLYNFILIPFLLTAYYKDEGTRSFMTKVVIFMFIAYYYYEMVIALNMRYYSYYINF